jgi:hypothetical protein
MSVEWANGGTPLRSSAWLRHERPQQRLQQDDLVAFVLERAIERPQAGGRRCGHGRDQRVEGELVRADRVRGDRGEHEGEGEGTSAHLLSFAARPDGPALRSRPRDLKGGR